MKVLLVCSNHNSLALLDLCTEIAWRDVDLKLFAVCDRSTVDRYGERMRGAGCQVIVLDPDHATHTEQATTRGETGSTGSAGALRGVLDLATKHGPIGLVAHLVLNTSLALYMRARRISRRLTRLKQNALNILAGVNPDVVLSISDRSNDYVESTVLWAARRKGVRIVLPYVAHFSLDVAQSYRRGPNGLPLSDFNPFWPISLYRLWVYWRLRHTVDNGLLFQPPYLLAAHARAGTLSRYPWWVGNGHSDIVCTSSRHMADTYARHRVPRAKLRIVGDINYDKLHTNMSRRSAIKDETLAKYGLDVFRKTIVLAMPQFREQGLMDNTRHWATINRMMAILASVDANLLVSLHPRMDSESYRHLEGQFQCRIADERLSEIVVVGDAFVALYSSTVVWAVLCGIRPIILNLEGVRSTVYDFLRSAVMVYDIADLKTRVSDVLADPNKGLDEDWDALSRREVFDGRTVDRYAAIMAGSA